MKLLCKHIPRIAWLGVLAGLAVYTGGEKPQLRPMRNYMAEDADGLTNRLHFIAIAVSSNAVAFSAAWPATNPPPDGARWERKYVNGFGERVRTEWSCMARPSGAPSGGGEILTQRRRDVEYDVKGRLAKIEETGKPTEYRHYNNLSECTNTTLVGQAPRACRQRIRENDTRYGFNAHFRAENIKEGCELELVHK